MLNYTIKCVPLNLLEKISKTDSSEYDIPSGWEPFAIEKFDHFNGHISEYVWLRKREE